MISMLNGWRRMGIVLLSIWLIGIASITIYEFVTHTPLFFSSQNIPKGTTMTGNNVTLPNGKVVTIKVPQDLLTGELAKPWEINWSLYPEIPKITIINWKQLGLSGIVIPLTLWIIIEFLVIAIAWIARGFKEIR